MYLNYYIPTKPSFDKDKFYKELVHNKGRIGTKVISELRGKYAYTSSQLNVALRMQGAQQNIDAMPLDYTEFRIPKASGGFRVIDAPNARLKFAQRTFVNILNKHKVLSHNAAHGFTQHRSCKTALQVHQANQSRWFLKIDVKDFFPSIKEEALFTALNNLAVFNLTMHPNRSITLKHWLKIMFKDGGLPQGSPASPILSNLYMVEADYRLTKMLPELTYTRYADDLLFSCTTHFDWRHVVELVGRVLGDYGLEIKQSKTRYGSFNGANWNLGLMYNNNLDITVGFRNKKLLKNIVHNMYRDKESFSAEEWELQIQKVSGILSYYKHIEPEYFAQLINKYKQEGKTELLVV